MAEVEMTTETNDTKEEKKKSFWKEKVGGLMEYGYFSNQDIREVKMSVSESNIEYKSAFDGS